MEPRRRSASSLFGPLLAASLMVVVGCSSDAPSSQSAPAESSQATEPVDSHSALDAAVASFVGDGPGGVDVLIRRDGATSHFTGGTETADAQPLTTGQIFRVGSISKPFIATMVLQLVEDGSVDLEQTLDTYLPAISVGPKATLRQLLSHQSGVANYTDQPSFFADLLADPERHLTADEILSYVADEPIGEVDTFSYSNTNYILLGQLIEHLDDTDLNTSLANRITTPLGLANTYFDTADQPIPSTLAAGWSPEIFGGSTDKTYDSVTTSAWAAGALLSTTDDLAAFLAALITDGELISAASFTEMTDTGTSGYGLGVFAASLGPDRPGVAHSGGIPGYTSTMAISPETGDILVILTNSDLLSADQLAPNLLAVW